MSFRHGLWRQVFVLTAMVAACDSDGGDVAPDAIGTDGDAVDYRATVLRADSYTAGGRTWSVTLARIDRPDGGRTYVHWLATDRTGVQPAVITTMPYEGIAWTDDPIDARWAMTSPQPSGQYLDVDGPGFDGDDEIVYYPTSIASANQQALLHLLNDASVLQVYGRFYAGGTVRDEIEDMRAGTWFLAEQANVDLTRVGVMGASWGGFEALHAAASADARVAPAAVVALFPPSDLAAWVGHVQTRAEPTRTFLEPYLRRIFAATGGPPDTSAGYVGLRATDLCTALPASTLLLHDELDNLVPIAQTESLIASCGGDAIYWRRTGAPDPSLATHGPLLTEPGFASVYTYAYAYLHLRLAPSSQLVFSMYAPAGLGAHVHTIHEAQARGEDVAFAAPRLRELCDPRTQLIDATTSSALAGADALATAMNGEWGTSYTGASVCAALANGLPPP